ncbi:MAG: PEP-CTERM sorting domain-containing protein [Hydrococcus sp. Prado102]|nr:PEP-CTERM sorting domain-containing protein [Hydrococcus sp. Prado102]
MKRTYIFTGFALATIALNSDRALVLAATTGNPFYNPMKENVYSDSTSKNPSSDSMTGEVTQLLGSSSPSTSESNAIGESSEIVVLNSTEATFNSSDPINSTEVAANSSDTSNSTEVASNSSDTFNSTEATSNSATTLNLSQESDTTNAFNLTETSNLTEAFIPTENFNSTEASNSTASDLEPVPEPLTIFGTGLALGFGVLFNREHSKKQKAIKHKSE